MKTVTVTTVIENTAARGDLDAEHGLAFWVETGGRVILLDTGQSDLYLRNAARLNLDLNRVSDVALSHGHYDHTGGLAAVLTRAARAKVWLHPAAMQPKYHREANGRGRPIGMPAVALEALSDPGRKVGFTEGPTEIAPGLFVTGPVPRVTDFEDTGGAFFADEACSIPDLLPDDQALFFEGPDGLVVLLGCAHAGIINTLNYVMQLTGNRVHTVLGGTHLRSATRARLDRTIESLRQMAVQRLGPAHCTGTAATEQIRRTLPEAFVTCAAGSTWRLT